MKLKLMARKLRLIPIVSLAALSLFFVSLSVEAQKQKNVKTQTYTETINRVGIEMVRIPNGKFIMGSPPDEKDRQSEEGPQHEVTISSFYIGKYEITQAQWRAVARLPKVKIELNAAPSQFKGDNLPVEQVTWYEAVEFCERLSKEMGKSYRLPTEAEWEYACRARTIGKYAGNLDAMAWYGNNSHETTHPVGTKQANRFGLYDMHGNVWEWCQDLFWDYSSNPQTDPTTNLNPSRARILRGGSWIYGTESLRSALRGGSAPDRRDQRGELGFRIARTYK